MEDECSKYSSSIYRDTKCWSTLMVILYAGAVSQGSECDPTTATPLANNDNDIIAATVVPVIVVAIIAGIVAIIIVVICTQRTKKARLVTCITCTCTF